MVGNKVQYDVMLLSETNKNIADVDKWDGYTCFFSTDIDPKIRGKAEKQREGRKYGIGKGRGKSNYKKEPDFENAGVAIVSKTPF